MGLSGISPSTKPICTPNSTSQGRISGLTLLYPPGETYTHISERSKKRVREINRKGEIENSREYGAVEQLPHSHD